VDIDAAEPRTLERRRRQNQPVGNDHQSVELQAAQQLEHLRRFEARRLLHGKPMDRGEGFNRARAQRLTAAGRPVRLGKDGADPLCLHQRAKRRDGEFRRAGETQLERRMMRAQGSKSRCGGAGRSSPSRRRAIIAALGSLLTLFFQSAANQLSLELG
jgi:hypothetical protein